jgi:hypothetical protein
MTHGKALYAIIFLLLRYAKRIAATIARLGNGVTIIWLLLCFVGNLQSAKV